MHVLVVKFIIEKSRLMINFTTLVKPALQESELNAGKAGNGGNVIMLYSRECRQTFRGMSSNILFFYYYYSLYFNLALQWLKRI